MTKMTKNAVLYMPGHKTSHKGQFFLIDIYTSSEI